MKGICQASCRLRKIANNVVLDYGALAPLKLRNMLCKEFSWRNARNDLAPEEGGCVMQLSDIRKDAEKIREYDLFADRAAISTIGTRKTSFIVLRGAL